jgi:hypothetical protein
MKLAPLLASLIIAYGLLLVTAVSAYSHDEGLDAYGCHNNRKHGGYHCHRGAFAGESFASKEEMLKKLKGEKTPTKVQEKPGR